MTEAIAIVGMACRYPDADSPEQLWQTVLSQRRAFRHIPPVRLRIEDYLSDDADAADATYLTQAAVLDGWEFDRVRFRVAGSTFRSTDMAHWLALEVAADALADAGWADAEGLRRDRTGVLVGNTLTGEFSRANLLRLRWPYVRRVFASALGAEGWSDDERQRFLDRAERAFKAPFAAMDEDALAGGLSNTIAGRICNTLDLGGGGYTVDGACAASLLAITNACTALTTHELDVVLAGGVDLSLDPFELVGFAKAGAFAPRWMCVYDKRSQGFWPGEGCGFVVLERLEDTLARGGRPYAVIRGWGVSSDGSGSIIRPGVGGQLLALRRAYARAGFGIDVVDLFEGHGTGTAVGDQVELTALTTTRREFGARGPAAIGSIKANIGHTKAAAGVAGLIKATLSLRERVIPPTTGCQRPHDLLTAPDALLRPVSAAEPWPHAGTGRAAVSAMGFGGINTHVVLDGPPSRRSLPRGVRKLSSSPQDCELFVLAASDRRELIQRVDTVRAHAAGLSLAELGDLAGLLYRELPRDRRTARAAVVASTPAELTAALDELGDWLEAGDGRSERGIALGFGPQTRQVGLLFPGQASPVHSDGGALVRRFPMLASAAVVPAAPHSGERAETAVAQPAIVASSLLGLALLARLDLRGAVGVGHSLGELTALHWAGAISAADLRTLVAIRGKAMAELGHPDGAMASIEASAADVAPMLADHPDVVIAGYNAPRQTTISGRSAAIDAVVRRAEQARIRAVRLPVSHAFHSPLVAAARGPLRVALEAVALTVTERAVFSTVTGKAITEDTDLRSLLVEQLTLPVRFQQALAQSLDGVDALLEVGPGHVLRDLARVTGTVPVLALEAGSASLRPPLVAAGALWSLGCRMRLGALFAGRFTRPLSLDSGRHFLANPCEQAPLDDRPPPIVAPTSSHPASSVERRGATSVAMATHAQDGERQEALAVLRRNIALRTELPEDAITGESYLLGDLHLTSIAVSELAAAVASDLGRAPLPPTTELANATVAELAAALDASDAGSGPAESAAPDGVAAWFRPFAVRLVEQAPPTSSRADPCRWRVIAPDGHPFAAAVAAAFGADTDDHLPEDEATAIVVCLAPERDDRQATLLLQAGRQILAHRAPRCAFLQHDGGAAGFAKTLHLERPELNVCVIDLPPDPALLALARLEAETTSGFREVTLDKAAIRRVPVLRPIALDSAATPVGAEDVVVISGGGKGIGAECALALARASGAAVALLGRADPAVDAQLAENLRRFERAGVRHLYVRASVTDRASVRVAVERIHAELGAVTGVVHCAGVNVPARIQDLDDATVVGTLAPKLAGLRHLLAAIDRDQLRLLVTFGSIIGRTGLRGEAHYALANDWLALETSRLSRELPTARCLNIEWSVWSGAGMGERLGTIAALAQQGVSPIPIDLGVELFKTLIASEGLPPSLVLSGRFGALPTVTLDAPPLPVLRFLERVPVHYPAIELVAEADLSRGTDPYLDDHLIDGVALLPVVLALEAMASVAGALTGQHAVLPEFRDVVCLRPVTVPTAGNRVVRIAALAHENGSVALVIRSDETGFQTDHVRATCCFDGAPLGGADVPTQAMQGPVDINPASDLYGGLLFQGSRFRRIERYRELGAHSCVADVRVDQQAQWFGVFLPQELVLGDPGARDAVIHAIQCCIPHEQLVPVGVHRLRLTESGAGPLTMQARERWSDGETFHYDVVVFDAEGHARERWDGLALRRIGAASTPLSWPVGLLVPYLERRAAELVHNPTLSIALMRGHRMNRQEASERAIAGALRRPTELLRRPDGRPEAADNEVVSAAHLDGYTLAVAANAPVACDVEVTDGRSNTLWNTLLDPERQALARLLARDSGEDIDVSATRVWAALECMKKAGVPLREPLKLTRHSADGWTLLHSVTTSVATLVTRVHAVDRPVAIAVLAARCHDT